MFIEDDGTKKADDENLLPESYLQLGKSYFYASKYVDAKEAFEEANDISVANQFRAGIDGSVMYLDKIDSLVESGQELKKGFLSRSIQSLELNEKIARTSLDWNISSKIKAAEAHFARYEYDEAIADYTDAIDLLTNKGDDAQILVINGKIEEINRLKNINQDISANYEQAIAEQERILKNLSGDTLAMEESAKPEVEDIGVDLDSIEIVNSLDLANLTIQSDSLNELADEYLRKEDFEAAERYRLLSAQVDEEIRKREDTETQLMFLRQQKELSDLELENQSMLLQGQRQERQQLVLGLGLLITLAIALSALYIFKRRAHRNLGKAYYSLEETKSKLADAERNIRQLLRQQVSEDIAKELMAEGSYLTTKKSFVCIMFLDIRGFTPWAEQHAPEEIIEYQNRVFGFMIDIINKHHGNVNQLLGDGFMATFGAPKSSGNDCQNAFDAAVAILHQLQQKMDSGQITKTRIGIGLHAGNVVTGNVGSDMRKQYSITGNTVILASRIEQLNKEFGSQLIISREVHDQLENFEGSESFREVIVKGTKYANRGDGGQLAA